METDSHVPSMASDIINDLAVACTNLTEALAAVDSDGEQTNVVRTHIQQLLQKPHRIQEFQSGLEWFNVLEPLSLAQQLRGKIVVLDFFTYCCINCLHVLPDLKLLESRYSVQDGVVVVGVHSAKFDNEKDSANIRAALERYDITHAVVNDADGIMWHQLGIPCWPTLLILSPEGVPLFVVMGEGRREDLLLFVKTSVEYFCGAGQLLPHALPLAPRSHLPPGPLLYPGKVAACPLLPGRLAVADTGHHRVMVVTEAGKIEFVIGGNGSGFVDGSFGDARFHNPQGLAFLTPDLLFVADTDNHAVRRVCLSTGTVTTVAGTGVQGGDREGGGEGTAQPLSSPWDLALVSSSILKAEPGEDRDRGRDVLLVAMAGCHQIWGLFLQPVVWWKSRRYAGGSCAALLGSGKEENRNNSYPHAAGFAQPSGLSLSGDQRTLFVADSESSSVRQVALDCGKTSALVGGDRSPTNLFGFGDADGRLYEAKLQHPLGVAWCAGRLYVTDSYNHKVKVVDLGTSTSTTLLGSGKPGSTLGDFTTAADVQLSEPGGLCASHDSTKLYIADTNNHSIKVVDLLKKTVTELELFYPTETDAAQALPDADATASVDLGLLGGQVKVDVCLSLAHGLHFTPQAPQRWTLKLPHDGWRADRMDGDHEPRVTVSLTAPPSTTGSTADVGMAYRVFLCRGDEACFVRTVRLKLQVRYGDNGVSSATCRLDHVVS